MSAHRVSIGGPRADSASRRVAAYYRAERWGWAPPQAWVWIGAPLVDDPGQPSSPVHTAHGASSPLTKGHR